MAIKNMDLHDRMKRSFYQDQIQDVVQALKASGKWSKSLSKFQALKEELHTCTGKYCFIKSP